MTAQELYQHQLQSSGGQLSKVLKGIDASSQDFRLHDGGMSIGESVAHLCEVYQAVLTMAAGGTHDWGSHKPAAADWDGLVAEALDLRSKAVGVTDTADDEKIKMGSDFIVFHDLYHVGQLATMRLSLHPHWNLYEIYE